MTRRVWLPALITTVGLLIDPVAAEACSCMDPGPACQAFWKTDAVFDATVESLEPTTQPDSVGGAERRFMATEYLVRMSVRQAWTGVQPGTVEVVTNTESSACGFEFKVGKRYLVFASKRAFDGRWTTSICTQTQEYDGTGEAADFLSSLLAPARGGRVFGTVKASRDVDIASLYACARTNYSLSPAGAITGRAVGPDGRPISNVTIEVTAADARPHPRYGLSTMTARTDHDGYFEVRGLPAGQYIVGVNLSDLPSEYNPYARTVYPSDGAEPHIVTLSLGQSQDIGAWRLPPPLAAVRVSGVVTWQDGTPAARVFVSARDETGGRTEFARGAGGSTSGADGRFTIDLREGRVYTFVARPDNGPFLPISAPRIVTNRPLEPIRIVILKERPGGDVSPGRDP